MMKQFVNIAALLFVLVSGLSLYSIMKRQPQEIHKQPRQTGARPPFLGSSLSPAKPSVSFTIVSSSDQLRVIAFAVPIDAPLTSKEREPLLLWTLSQIYGVVDVVVSRQSLTIVKDPKISWDEIMPAILKEVKEAIGGQGIRLAPQKPVPRRSLLKIGEARRHSITTEGMGFPWFLYV